MRMHLEGVKKGLPAVTPRSIMTVVSIVVPVSATDGVVVAVPAMASEDVARPPVATVRSAAIPATITCIVAVNKLGALFIKLRTSAAAPLTHGCGRQAKGH